jgi:aspartyl-tRNA(Asn)/glutamyl-tRNA(Gln) amidotransferase subunit A
MADAWLWMSAAALGREIERGAIDPRDLAEAYGAAIAAHPEGARIYARTTPARARAEAAAAAGRARAGVRRGPLDGVPVSWKDLFDSAGVATEAGSALLSGRVPERDAMVLARATRAGLVCLGKTHMSELAFSGLGINPVTATPPNINDEELAPGGSSSGAAASVAFGLAAAGIGSDTNGSVRIPAAWNDLVGFKPAHGLLPLDGTVPLSARFDTVGPLCRSVEDAALLLAALGDGRAPDLAGAALAGAQMRVLDTAALGETRAGPAAAFEAAVQRLETAGARIERGPVAAVAEALPLSQVLTGAEACATWWDTIEAQPDLMFAPVRERFRAGADIRATAYIGTWARLETLREAYLAATAGFDAVLLPTTPIPPPPVAALLADHALFAAENLLALRNTRIANVLGLCALTLPTETPSCGLMMLAPPGHEARLLRLGAAAERALA